MSSTNQLRKVHLTMSVQNGAQFPRALNRKIHPGICPKNGPQFPKQAANGKRIPLSNFKAGCAFVPAVPGIQRPLI